jgi:uncharacterized phage protein gp47/JayE
VEILSVSQIYEEMISYFVGNQDKITDLNTDQALDTQLQVFGRQLNQAYVKMAGGIKKQFEVIPFQMFNFPRRTEEYASTNVQFTRVESVGEKIIPSGTVIGTVAGILFVTTEDATILNGNTNSDVINAIAQEAGSASNVPGGTITQIISSIDGVNTVTNTTSSSGGEDQESNTDYFRRFSIWIQGLSKSNTYGVLITAISTPGIVSGAVENHFPPEDDIYNFTVYVDDGSGSTPSALLDEVYLRVRGNDTAEYPGAAAAGINFKIESAGLVTVNVELTLDLDPVLGDETAMTELVGNTLINYINHLWAGSDVLISKISSTLYNLPTVYNVYGIELNSGTSDISIEFNQVAKLGTVTVNYNSEHPR